MRAERIRSFFCIVGASCRRASIRMRVFDPSVHVLLLCVSSHSTSAASVISGEVPSTAGEALSAARDSRDGARNASEPAPKTPRRPIERAARAFPAESSHSRRGVTARAVNDTRAHVAITVVSYDVRARAE